MELNEQQKRAVEHSNGSILVIAGAGSGKTRVITQRIINFLTNHLIAPQSLLALTFTNKAAQEMRERVAHVLPATWMPTITTFHGYCLQLLRKYGHIINLPTFTILDSDDQITLIQSLLKKNNLEKQIAAKSVAHQISSRKNTLLSSTETTHKFFQEIFTAYEREKMLNKAIDFDDLLVHTHRLFLDVEFKTTHQQKIRHILVDEYQDTNIVQHALLKQMAGKDQNALAIDSLCVVGDEDQSIYAWRGATVVNILNFSQEFANTTRITMEQNYRSQQSILDASNALIEHNKQRNPKKLWSEKSQSNRIALVTCNSDYQEGDCVVQTIKSMRTNKISGSMACLYRAHHQSRIIEEALIRASLPYTIVGGIQFYERKEIKDLLAYLRLAINGHDRLACFRILNCPPRGLGAKFEELLDEYWQNQPLDDFSTVIRSIMQQNVLTDKKNDELEKLLRLLDEIKASSIPSKALELILERTRYFTYLVDTYDEEEADAKKENIKEFMRALLHFEQQGITTLEYLLQEITLMQEKSAANREHQENIFLMTCHAAKGLEFDVVMIVGLEEGLFPSSRGNAKDEEQIQEERRLLYVGITRAREWLLLTHARSRYTYGTLTDQRPSRFLQEIAKHVSSVHDVSKSGLFEIQKILQQWINPRATSSRAQHFAVHATKIAPDSQQSVWQKHKTVRHAIFGLGIIRDVEVRADYQTYVTAQFSIGTKKIKSEFLTPM